MRFLKLLMLAILALTFIGGEYAFAARPRNPRRKKQIEQKKRRRNKRRKAKAKKIAADKAKHLKSVQWKEEVWRTIERLVEVRGNRSRGFNPRKPPIAVIALNDTLIVNDLGLAVFGNLVDEAKFKFSDDFWDLLPIGFGRQRARSGYERFRGEPVTVWLKQPTYRQYRHQLHKTYRDICRRRSRKECRAFIASLWIDFREDEVRDYARRAIHEELRSPLDVELLQLSPLDDDPLIVRKGLRFVPQMKKLVSLLLKFGFDVRIISADSRLVMEEIAVEYGLDPSQTIGVEVLASSTTHIVTGQVASPVPVGSGRAAAMFRRVPREPALIVGAHYVDLEMLKYGRGIKLLIDHGDSAMLEFAAEKRWLVQPAFTRQ